MIQIKKEELVNPFYLREVAIEVLEENLGIVGTAMFLQQLHPSQGDYTKEKQQMRDDITIDDFKRDLALFKKGKNLSTET